MTAYVTSKRAKILGYLADPATDRLQDEAIAILADASVAHVSRLRKRFGKGSQAVDRSGVYFIQSGRVGPVKIGWSQDPGGRLRMLQIGNPEPLLMLAVYECDQAFEEKRFQEAFSHLRIRGEWFRLEEELVWTIHQLQMGNEPFPH